MVHTAASARDHPPPVLKGLRAWRRVRDLTQAQVAQQLGMSVPRYSELEQGKSPPKLHIAVQLSGILEASLDDLFPDCFPDNGGGHGRRRTKT